MKAGDFEFKIKEFGRMSRERSGSRDVLILKVQMALSKIVELTGRLLILFSASPVGWFVGVVSLAFHMSMESQFVHAIMHGAYVGLPGAEDLTPQKFETLAVPMQTKTWGMAHAIHHRKPSLVGIDPDVLHPFYRVHPSSKWRWFHIFNSFLGPITVFENCAFNYNRLLKKLKLRPDQDRGELIKVLKFVSYQYVLFAVLAGDHWWQVLIGNLAAVLLRNLVASGLQMASSVGHEVSTLHAHASKFDSQFDYLKFQIESSKNFKLLKVWKYFVGGLDRHIEHHLYPAVPPSRLHDFSKDIQALCRQEGIQYQEFPSLPASLKDSISYLAKLSVRSGV